MRCMIRHPKIHECRLLTHSVPFRQGTNALMSKGDFVKARKGSNLQERTLQPAQHVSHGASHHAPWGIERRVGVGINYLFDRCHVDKLIS